MKVQSIRAWLTEPGNEKYQVVFDLLPDYMFRQTTVIFTPEDFVQFAERVYDWGYEVGRIDGYNPDGMDNGYQDDLAANKDS